MDVVNTQQSTLSPKTVSVLVCFKKVGEKQPLVVRVSSDEQMQFSALICNAFYVLDFASSAANEKRRKWGKNTQNAM